MLALSRRASAQSSLIPTRLQADLLGKVASYDRNFARRAQGNAIVLLVQTESAESSSFASEMKSALSSLGAIGDVRHEEQIVTYENAVKLAETCRTQGAAVVYLGPGFAKQLDAIRDALSPLDILSVGGGPDYVSGGIVLGFDLVFGRPKLLVNLTQARKQHVDFRAEVLNLMKVYE